MGLRGPKPGGKTGGRQKGTPNQITAEAREVFRAMLDRLAPKAEGWIEAAAKEDPARGAELLLRLSERFVPVLSRQQLAIEDGGSLADLFLEAQRLSEARKKAERPDAPVANAPTASRDPAARP